MKYVRMPIEIESPEEIGYELIKYNLAESSVSDLSLDEINIKLSDLKLQYTHHLGLPALRELISKENNLATDDICLTAGAAAALFIVNTSLLEREDHLIVVHPNYGTNFETPRAIGCDITYIKLTFEEQYQFNIADFEKAIKPNTKLISITNPHNPTGTVISEENLSALIRLCETKNIYLLIDETYRDLCFGEKQSLISSRSTQCISVSSLSKAYGMPGIRIGWIACKNKALNEIFLAAKEQIMLCNSVIDEEIAYQFYQNKEKYLTETIALLKQKREILFNWFATEKRLECVLPAGGVVAFPRVKSNYNFDAKLFHHSLLHEFQTFVGTGKWFEQDDKHFRLGYGWLSLEDFKIGLDNISKALDKSIITN